MDIVTLILSNPVLLPAIIGAGAAVWHKLFTTSTDNKDAKLDAAIVALSETMDVIVSTARKGITLQDMRVDAAVMQHMNAYIVQITSDASAPTKADLHDDAKAAVAAHAKA
jgi:hypothetical protein